MTALVEVEQALSSVYSDKSVPIEKRMVVKEARVSVLERLNHVRTFLGQYDYGGTTASPIGWDF